MVIAFFAQALSIASSVATTLVLPKALGIESFGYWQLFLFYVSYIGFFHLGLNDGIYLLFGGRERAGIEKTDINSQLLFGCLYQVFISVAIFMLGVLGPFEEERSFVIFATSALLTVNNAGAFLGYLFQAMNETKLFSKSVVVESAFLFFGLAALLAQGVADFRYYIVLFCLSKTVRLAYSLFYARDFLVSGVGSARDTARKSILSIRVGIKLMFANIAGQLILGVVRFFVDLEWGIEVFSIVSFSLSITTFFLMFLSQVSMVLFPHLRQVAKESMGGYYELLRNSLSLFLPGLYCLYPLISVALNAWLPEYCESIQLFIILFPLCVFEGKMDIVCTTFFKVLRLEGKLLAITCITLLASLAMTILGTYVFHSVALILMGVTLVLGIRCFSSERIIEGRLAIRHASTSWSIIVVSVLFIALFCCLDQAYALLAYLLCYAGYLCVYGKTFKSTLLEIKNNMRRN